MAFRGYHTPARDSHRSMPWVAMPNSLQMQQLPFPPTARKPFANRKRPTALDLRAPYTTSSASSVST